MNNQSADNLDVAIIGSGLGGLISACILSEYGYKVAVFEKNAQIGGTLQTFFFDGVKFDTGVHYIGGLDKGQPLYPYFKYLGLFDDIEYKKLDPDGYDHFSFEGDDQTYPHAQGYNNFVAKLGHFFPEEREGIKRYIQKVKDVCSAFSLYYLKSEPNINKELELLYESAKDVINSCVSNRKLRAILGANNLLYAGGKGNSPFYVHALVSNSYIESAYKVVGGGSQIARVLARKIKANGGIIYRANGIREFLIEGKTIKGIVTDKAEVVRAKNYISNIHPTTTLKMMDHSKLRKSYTNRLLNLSNTISAFVVYIVLKERTMKHRNHNRYHIAVEDVWDSEPKNMQDWGKSFAVYFTESKKHKGYCRALALITYMKWEDVDRWDQTENHTLKPDERDESYQKFKEKRAETLIENASNILPELNDSIESYTTSTPLTLRDYIGGPEGSLYGVDRSFKSPMKSHVNSRTKFKNLFFVGQNTTMHGVLGVTIGAVNTCSHLIGRKELVDRIRVASE
jgi:all-trans-retinol 13,14-reductase